MKKTAKRLGLGTLVAALALGATLGLAGCNSSSDTDADQVSGGDQAASSTSTDRADDDIDWQYMTADELVQMLDAGDPVIVLDTRTDDMYDAGHIIGAYHVAVFPVDTTEAEETLKEAAANLEGDDPIVVVCKTGNKGAKRAISVLQEVGIDASRLYILEGGGEGWTSEEWTTTEDDSTVPNAA